MHMTFKYWSENTIYSATYNCLGTLKWLKIIGAVTVPFQISSTVA